MPPKTRGSKITKPSKENVGVNTKKNQKTSNTGPKRSRKALADKTNSASDDNASILTTQLTKKVNACDDANLSAKNRPRRDRRLPTRYIECNLLQNLSNSKNAPATSLETSIQLDTKKIPVVVISPLKIPETKTDSTLTAKKPKRICKLPSRFEDHLISPNKIMPVHPTNASTPKVRVKVTKTIIKKDQNKKVILKNTSTTDKSISNREKRNRNVTKKSEDTSMNNSADTNNNADKNQLPQSKAKNVLSTPTKLSNTRTTSRIVKSNLSFKVLEDKNNSLKRNAKEIDIYEFTYDPNEEPPPQKKKRKKPVKKRDPKPKSVFIKNNYDKNLAKALLALKDTVSLKTAQPVVKVDDPKMIADNTKITVPDTHNTSNEVDIQPRNDAVGLKDCQPDKSQVSKSNYNSIRVEDIALDFEQENNFDEINYSPANSPANLTLHNVDIQKTEVPVRSNDPLNLQDDLSFFDDQPVASSSMNISTRHPEASPWRVEFNNLPIKWQVNTYVKPNMTPAFDSSFINFNESKKKHVYTNMGSDDVNTNNDNNLPQIFEENTTKLKQTSIISFIKEVVEKSTKKEKEKKTPIKTNTLFEDLNDISVVNNITVAQAQVTPAKDKQNKDVSSNVKIPSNENVMSDISNENTSVQKRKDGLKKSNKKKKNTDITYFGFDESECQDQENVSPTKKVDKRRLRALKPRSRAVLQEINAQTGPIRAALPVAMKSKAIESSEANDLFDQIKSASEPPVFPEIQNSETIENSGTNITELQNNQDSNNVDSESVHLFEDLEVVHHLKANRKSYGKTKKTVTFRQNSVSDSDVVSSDVAEQSASSDEDDLHDLTFKVPVVEQKKTMKKKKKTKKPKLSKKEEQEVEAWAAGFNSMCEDIEEFDLVVE